MNNYSNASIHSSKHSYNWWYKLPESIKNTASALNNYAQTVEKLSESHEKQYFCKVSPIVEKLEFSDYDSNIVCETALIKDWLLPQEDIAWKDL